ARGGHRAGEERLGGVLAEQDADPAELRLEDPRWRAGREAPLLALEPRRHELVLRRGAAVGGEEAGAVARPAGAGAPHRAGARPRFVSKSRGGAPGERPHLSRWNRVGRGLSCAAALPSGAKRRARLTGRRSPARRTGPEPAQMWTATSRARLPCSSSTSLIRAF